MGRCARMQMQRAIRRVRIEQLSKRLEEQEELHCHVVISGRAKLREQLRQMVLLGGSSSLVSSILVTSSSNDSLMC
jgi:hypothetical protein